MQKIILTFLSFFFLNPAFAIDVHDHRCAEDYPDAVYPYYSDVNGCGPGSIIGKIIPNKILFGKVNFTHACDNHDRCVMTLSKTESECAYAFRIDLQAACDRGWPSIAQTPIWAACMAYADTKAEIVRQVGHQWYKVSQNIQGRFDGCVAEHGWQPLVAQKCKNGTCVKALLSDYSYYDFVYEDRAYLNSSDSVRNMIKGEMDRQAAVGRARYEADLPRQIAFAKAYDARQKRYEGLLRMPLDSLEALYKDILRGKVPEDERVGEIYAEWIADFANPKKTLDIEVQHAILVFKDLGKPCPDLIFREATKRNLGINHAELSAIFHNKIFVIQETDGVRTFRFEPRPNTGS